jgi:Protein of unknown function (DUF1269)
VTKGGKVHIKQAEGRLAGNFGRSSLPKSACRDGHRRDHRSRCGALSGSLTNYGIRDDFIRKFGETIPERSSPLFVLFRSVREDKVLPEIEASTTRLGC